MTISVSARSRSTGIKMAMFLLAWTLILGSGHSPKSKAADTSADALQRRISSELKVFTDWLEANNVKGYIGEVGWPEDPVAQAQWNAVADRWYEDADAANLWVTAWSTGEWWGTDYNLAIYEDRIAGSGVDTPNAQASILESHPSTRRYLRGINVAGGEFASPAAEMEASFSNANPGLYGVDYHYDSQGTFHYISSRGIRVVRIPFRWERVQPSLGKRLAHREVRRLKRVVDRARTAGLKVVLDMHNYGAYYLSDGNNGVRCPIGSAQCTVAQFADVWKRLSLQFKDIRAVAGYGLMNEPVGLPDSTERSAAEVWERASQRAVSAIRATGDSHLVLVSGYNWSGVQGWSTQHPDAWIHDSANRFRYEAHHYWDQDHSGDYPDSYLTEVALAEGG